MEEWNCKVCTFLNHGLLDSCEICGTKKCIPSPRTNQDTKCIIQDQSNVSTSMKRKDDSIQVGRTLGSPSSSLQYSGKIFKTNSQTLQYFIPFSCSHILISAFCFDYEWLLGSVLPRNKPTTLIVHNPQESSSLQPSQVINDGYITRIIPKRPRGRCCMHSKFILIWTADYLRFIITTANMLDFDFDGRVENLLFVQDFKVGSQIANDNFRSGLVTMLKDHSVTDSIIKKLDGIDFSTAKVNLSNLVPSCYFYSRCLQVWRSKLRKIRSSCFSIRNKGPCS